METDESGRVLCVSVHQDGEEVKLVRYRYDDRGDMVETIDALDVSKHFVYSGGHLLVQLTNKGACPSIGNMKVRERMPAVCIHGAMEA